MFQRTFVFTCVLAIASLVSADHSCERRSCQSQYMAYYFLCCLQSLLGITVDLASLPKSSTQTAAIPRVAAHLDLVVWCVEFQAT